jgi:hypothetical protein
MAWQKKKEFLDLRTGMHVIHLHEPESKAEHIIQINVGHESCPHCGHVKPQTNLEAFDAHKIVAEEIELLEKNHAAATAYAAKHKVPVRGK